MVWFVLLLVCPLAMFLMMRGMGHGSDDHEQPPAPSALELLEQRYARGDIDQAEFERMRETLTRGHGSHVG